MLDETREDHQQWNSLYEIFRSKVEPNRSNPLIIFHGKHISYYSILSMADSMAESLRTRLKIGKGDKVALCLPLSPQFFVSFLALQKIGAVAVPLDPALKTYELNNALGLVRMKSVICLSTTGLEIDRNQGVESVVTVRIQDFLPFEKAVGTTARNLWARHGGISGDVQVVRFTDLIYEAKGDSEYIDAVKDISAAMVSASRDGELQAMLFTPANILESASAIAKSLAPTRKRFKITTFLPPFLPASFQFSVVLPLLLGGTVIATLERRNYYKALFTASLFDCDYILASPWDLSEILRERIPNLAMKSLKGFIASTYLLNSEIRNRVEKIYGTRVIEYYGLPEMLGVTHIQPMDRARQKAGSPGVPIPNAEARILEEKTHEEVGPGIMGELFIRGPGMFTTLVPETTGTSQYFLDGYFDSGDLASKDEDGLYYIEDRSREAITSHGILVSSNEIERLIGKIDGVKEVAVVGIEEENGNEYILAAVSSEGQGDSLSSRIMQECRKSLSAYKVPQKIEFRKELPKSMSGKILKRQIIDEHRKRKD